MPEYTIVLESKAFGEWIERRVSANSEEEALDDFLDEMGPHGVKRLGPTDATFLDELAISVRPFRVATMSAGTDFRLIRLSRETRDWVAAGAALAKRLAAEYEKEGVDPEPMCEFAWACQTVIDAWDAAVRSEEAAA